MKPEFPIQSDGYQHKIAEYSMSINVSLKCWSSIGQSAVSVLPKHQFKPFHDQLSPPDMLSLNH